MGEYRDGKWVPTFGDDQFGIVPPTQPTGLTPLLREECQHHFGGLDCGWCAAEKVLAKTEHYRADRDRLQQRLDAYHKALEAIRDFSDDQHCLPGCDRIAHEEMCPWCNPEAVLRRMASEALSTGGNGDGP